MQIRLDSRRDALCIEFTEFDDADVTYTQSVAGYFVAAGNVMLLFNKAGKLLGIEVEGAAAGMPPDFMRSVREGDGFSDHPSSLD